MPTTELRVKRLVGLMISAALVFGACSDPGQGDRSRNLVASGSARLPYSDFEDWVSYSDAVVSVTVVTVDTLDLFGREGDDETDADAGLQQRTITVEVDSILWQYAQTTLVPKAITFVGLPNVVDGGTVRPMGLGTAPRMEVGEHFVMPVTDSLNDGWFPISSEAVVPVAESKSVGDAKIVNVEQFDSDLRSISFEYLSSVLERTKPDPVADANRSLDVDERFDLVQEQWFADDEPGKGELTDAELAEREQ